MHELPSAFPEGQLSASPQGQLIPTQEVLPRNRIELTTNPILESIVGDIAQATPDWETIFGKFKIYQQVRRAIQPANLPGLLAELHLVSILESFSSIDPQVSLNPIEFGAETGHYRFTRNSIGNYFVMNSRTGHNFLELDAVAQVENLPVVFEIKTGHNRKSTGPRNGKGKRTNQAMSEPRIKQIFFPLRSYYGTDRFGYVVVIPSDSISKQSTVQEAFKARGGIVAPLYTSSQGFISDVRGVQDRFIQLQSLL